MCKWRLCDGENVASKTKKKNTSRLDECGHSLVDPLCSAIHNFSLHFTEFCIFNLCITFFNLKQLFERWVNWLCTVLLPCYIRHISLLARFGRSYCAMPCQTIHSHPFALLIIVFEMPLNVKFRTIFNGTTSKFFILKITRSYSTIFTNFLELIRFVFWMNEKAKIVFG